jgi:peroxiredoxin
MTANSSATSLKEAILEFQTQMASRAPASVLEKLGPEVEKLARSSYGSESPKIGAKASDFSLPDAHGATIHLADLLAKGPAVVTFYRGGWCPFCNLQLRAYQHIVPEIQSLDATLVAISPQTPDNSLSTAQKAELSFLVLSDLHNRVARTYGLVYRLSPGLQELQTMFGNEPPKFNGDDSWELPVPGTFIIDSTGIVRLASVDPDYTKRLEPAEILVALRELRS